MSNEKQTFRCRHCWELISMPSPGCIECRRFKPALEPWRDPCAFGGAMVGSEPVPAIEPDKDLAAWIWSRIEPVHACDLETLIRSALKAEGVGEVLADVEIPPATDFIRINFHEQENLIEHIRSGNCLIQIVKIP